MIKYFSVNNKNILEVHNYIQSQCHQHNTVLIMVSQELRSLLGGAYVTHFRRDQQQLIGTWPGIPFPHAAPPFRRTLTQNRGFPFYHQSASVHQEPQRIPFLELPFVSPFRKMEVTNNPHFVSASTQFLLLPFHELLIGNFCVYHSLLSFTDAI